MAFTKFRFALILIPLASCIAQERPTVLMTGLGAWRHKIETRSTEAQRFFDQGLALLYGFNRYESLRSFKKASELDPKAPMPYWGQALALGPHINMDLDADTDAKASCQAVQDGLKLATGSRREHDYLEAAAARCPDFSAGAYTEAMRRLAARYPDDLDAATLYAESLMIPVRWRWYRSDGTPAEGVREAERTLEEVLRRNPAHPGANHFYIHAVESSMNPERAVPSAQRLMGTMPSAGHLVHMPAHIWMQLGDYALSADINERAAEADRKYFAASRVTAGAYAGYLIHNLHFVVYARWMQGRMGDAIRAADALSLAAAPMADAMPEMVDPFLALRLFTGLRFAQWDAVLKTPEPGTKHVVNSAVWHFARAVASAAKGDTTTAQRERDAFEAVRASIPPTQPWLNNTAANVLAIASEALAARLADSPALALTHWHRAVELQDGLVYDEPPPWYQPLRESLGAALLKSGKAPEAEEVFREGLRRAPRNGRLLFGLLESLKAQGHTEAVESVSREFQAAWSKADVTLRLEDF